GQNLLPAAVEIVMEGALGQGAGGDKGFAHRYRGLPEEVEILRLVAELKDVGSLVHQDAHLEQLVLEQSNPHAFVGVVKRDPAAAITPVGIHRLASPPCAGR